MIEVSDTYFLKTCLYIDFTNFIQIYSLLTILLTFVNSIQQHFYEFSRIFLTKCFDEKTATSNLLKRSVLLFANFAKMNEKYNL